jgi:hypothetical protein
MAMTELLDKAFAEASKLPGQKQDEVATWILAALARWRPEKQVT